MNDTKKAGAPPARETNANILRAAIIPRASRLIEAEGELRLPCVPSMLEHHVKMLYSLFEQLGRPFTTEELAKLRGILERKLVEGFRASQYARLVVTYQTVPPPHPGIDYNIAVDSKTLEGEYATWVANRQAPLFGAHADSKVMLLAAELGPPAEVAVLDVGAGTGRNTLPLARAGHPTDAVEIAPALAEVLRAEVKKADLPIDVFEGDIFDTALALPEGRYKLVVLAEVVASHFRDADQIRRLAERIAPLLVPGGVLLFSAFIATDGYEPDALARELSQVSWCSLFTRAEIERAFEGLPFDRISDESVHDYEREHLPPEHWPPTGWFVQWTLGSDLFNLSPGKAPMELRWLGYRRR